MNAAGCHGAPRSFPDVQFPPVQHGVRKVRLRLMLHTSSKVSPLLFYLKESNLFYVGEWQHISQVFPGLSEWVNTFDNINGCCKACYSLACGASLPPFQYLLTAASVSCFQVCANPCCKEQTNIVSSGVCVCVYSHVNSTAQVQLKEACFPCINDMQTDESLVKVVQQNQEPRLWAPYQANFTPGLWFLTKTIQSMAKTLLARRPA